MNTIVGKTVSLGLLSAIFGTVFFGLAFTTHAQDTCTQLSYTLSIGSTDGTTGGDVTKLQLFLKSKGYFTDAVTGYYGPVTQQAVKTWQKKENFYEASGTGNIGVVSREKIAQSCNLVTITQQSVKSSSNKFKLSGTAEGVGSIFVAIVPAYTSEPTDWHTTYRNGTYVAFSGDTTIKVKKGKWSTTFSGIRSGTYEVRVYSNDDSSQKLLATQPLEVTSSKSLTFRAGSKKEVTLGVGQSAADGGVTITLNDVFLTNGLSGLSRVSVILQSEGYDAGSYSGGVGDYIPESGGGIVDDEAPNGSMRLKVKSIMQAMNAATFIIEAGKPKG